MTSITFSDISFRPLTTRVEMDYTITSVGLPGGESYTFDLTPTDGRYTVTPTSVTFNDSTTSADITVYLTTPDPLFGGVTVGHVVNTASGGSGLVALDDLGNKLIIDQRYVVDAFGDITNDKVIVAFGPSDNIRFVAVDPASNNEYFCPTNNETNVNNFISFLGSNHTTLDLTRVCTSRLTNLDAVFIGQVAFNQDISNWDVSNIKSMDKTFFAAITFNQDISTWNVSSLEDLTDAFRDASAFNQDLSSWDVSNVKNFSNCFRGTSVNFPMYTWNTEDAIKMDGMFQGNAAFNQDISTWNVSKVTSMSNMFNGAALFNQDLSGWDVRNISSEPTGFKTGANGTWVADTSRQPRWGQLPFLNDVIYGNGAPVDNDTGDDGNLYIDLDTFDIYGPRDGGVWTLNTDYLSQGKLMTGGVPPTPGDGEEGWFYVDSTAKALYGPKGPSGWPTEPLMEEGSGNSFDLIVGSGAPTASIGENGDYYIDKDAKAMYGPKVTGLWSGAPILGGTSGATPLNLLTGNANPGPTTGADGDWYFNTTTKTFFGPKTGGVWTSQGQLVAPATGGAAAAVAGSATASSGSSILDFISNNFVLIVGLVVILAALVFIIVR